MTQRPAGNITTRDVRMQVAGYRISEVLGDGASGIVFAALDPSGRAVALKVLKPELALSPKEQRRFVEEAARMRRVRHPSLVELLDAGELPDGGAYIAMARVPGQTLLQRLATAPLRFDVTLTLFEQLAEALAVLHGEGFVHRDVKPENIFVVEGDQRAILLDLGIARDMSSDPSTTTRAGMIRGTPAYMAPERFFGQPATPRSDIYELGVVLYYTLVGSLPWSSADNPTERMRPIMPAERGVVLPPRLSTTLMRALSADAESRPSTANEFAAAIAEALSPESRQFIAGSHTARGSAPISSSRAPGSRTATVPMAIPQVASAITQNPQPPAAAPAPAPAPGWPPPTPYYGHGYGAGATTAMQPTAVPPKRGASAWIAISALLGVALLVLGVIAVSALFGEARGAGAGRGPLDEPRRGDEVGFETFDAVVTPAKVPLPEPKGARFPGSPMACSELVRYVCSEPMQQVQRAYCVQMSVILDRFNEKNIAARTRIDAGCDRRLDAFRRAAAR